MAIVSQSEVIVKRGEVQAPVAEVIEGTDPAGMDAELMDFEDWREMWSEDSFEGEVWD